MTSLGWVGLHRTRGTYARGNIGAESRAGVATNDTGTSAAGSISGSGHGGRLSTTPPVAQALSRSPAQAAAGQRHACVLALARSAGAGTVLQ